MITIIAVQNKELKTLTMEEFRTAQAQLDFNEAQYWIDLEDPTEEEEQIVLRELFCFHKLAILDCQRERLNPERGDHPPKVEDYERYLFVIFNPIDPPIEQLDYIPLKKQKKPALYVEFPTRQINAFLGKNYLVTHHYEPSASISHVRELCGRNTHMLDRGPDYVFHLIVDELLDNYGPLTEYLDDMLEDLEANIFTDSQTVTLVSILNIKKGIMRLKRITHYQREILSRLSRGEFELISEREIFYYRNVYDHIVRTSDIIDNYRESISGLVELYMSVTSNKLNQVMKALTVLSSIFLPLTFIAGVYGMNFEFMPELHWKYGYLLVWIVMICVGAFQVWFFRKKGWLLDL
ncbi:MAG TPA: magnesium/cobalt transporter CorA [Patescibacteria group bacterium]|nr:magnesium/cobalt transporter CorA [Patescibacteria group bacterium]